MPRTSVSTAPGDRFFFLRPGTGIAQRARKESHVHVKRGSHNTRQEEKKKIYGSTMGTKSQRGIADKTNKTELLNFWTPTVGWKNQHNLCFLITSLETISNVTRELIGLMKMTWFDLTAEWLKITSKQKPSENIDCNGNFSPKDDVVTRQLKSPVRGQAGKDMELGTQVQVWMFPGRAWGEEDTGSVDLADGDGVGGTVKMCSDGALNVKR